METYSHLTIEERAPGVFAALASSTGAAGSNSGIVDLGDQTLVFDTTATLSAARDLFSAAVDLTGRAPTIVINSHSHPDHVHGNAVFGETSMLISSAVTRNEIARDGVQSMENMRQDLLTQSAALREQLASAANRAERDELESDIAFFAGVLNGYPTADDLRIPKVTFERQLDFHGSTRSARLLTVGGAHSACDAVLWLPGDDVVFAGDIIGQPILSLGHPENWWHALDQVASLAAKELVPGHGHVWPAEEGLAVTRRHLTTMFAYAEEALHAEVPLDYAEGLDVPAGQSGYWFRKDLAFLIRHRMAGKTW